jgi:hypothetical protein
MAEINDPFKTNNKSAVIDPFKTTQEQYTPPTFGQKAGAFTYGVGSSVLGGPGELERFATYTAPTYVQKKLGMPTTPPPKFGATLFPTTEEVKYVMKKSGIPEPRPELKKYEKRGELAGVLGTSLPGVIRGGAKVLLGAGSKISEIAAKKAEQLGFKLSPSQVREVEPAGAKGSTFNAHHNQTRANELASEYAGAKTTYVDSTFIRERYNTLGEKFNKIYKGKQFTIDEDAIKAINELANQEKYLPSNAQVSSIKNTAQNILNNFTSLTSKEGVKAGTFKIDGEALQRIRNDLSSEARSKSGQDARQIYQLIDRIDASIARNHPSVAKQLNEIRPLYKNTVILDDLYAKGGIQNGNISLDMLGNMIKGDGVKAMDKGDLERLGEIGSDLKIKALWQKLGEETTETGRKVTDYLGKIGGGLASSLGLRSAAARAAQRGLQTPMTPLGMAATLSAAGQAVKPLNPKEQQPTEIDIYGGKE